MELIEKLLPEDLQNSDHSDLSSLIIEELRRLHEGVLARYGLRSSQFKRWQEIQQNYCLKFAYTSTTGNPGG